MRNRLNATVFLAAVSLIGFGATASARAAGVVSTCDEAHLRTALSGGGLVTFSCGASADIVLTNTLTTQ